MRPHISAPLTTKFPKTPIGVFFKQGLLLALFISAAAAQTRLNNSQITSLKGDLQGPFSAITLRDVNSAADHGNGATNGIASAIADCGVTISCSIIVPPSYGLSEAVPGYQLNYATPGPAATTPGNISIYDRRYSDARMSVNNPGYRQGLVNALSGWLYDYYAHAPQNAQYASFFLRQWSLDGGTNQQTAALSYADKTTWSALTGANISHTPGQHTTFGITSQNTSVGDQLALKNVVGCSGGFTTEGDLGCRANDNLVASGAAEYSGTLTGTPSAGAASLAVSPVQGSFTQGSGRYLARMNAGTISTGTISTVSSPNNAPTTVTVSGATWPVSSVIAQLGTNVSSPGYATVTPTNFTGGSMAAIQTSSLVCIADQGTFEMVYPTSVTSSGFTATFTKVHSSASTISIGGLCGYVLDLTADDVTNATFPTKTQTVTGTLHFAWPVIASPTASTASIWVSGAGLWQQISSRWNATTANGYVLYPFAEVASSQRNGTLSDNLSLGANNVGWTSGDTVSEFLNPAKLTFAGNYIAESYYPNSSGSSGVTLNYNLPLQGTEAMLTLTNNTPVSMYASNGGTYPSPTGLHIIGRTAQSFVSDFPSGTAAIAFGCSAPCNKLSLPLAAANTAYFDFLQYDAGKMRWNITTNVNAANYSFGANQLAPPFSNAWLANDSNSNGYVEALELKSGSSANTDSSGELVFNNSASVTQTLQASYTTHPECSVRPQFDAGATNRHWISYSANSFTVTFAAAVTGSVSYSCSGRN